MDLVGGERSPVRLLKIAARIWASEVERRSTTKQRMEDNLCRNKGTVDRVDEVGAGAGCGLTILDKALSCLGALNKFLLDVVVIGRDCGENESQNTQNTD
jgi:hypothetical protein